LLKSKEEENTLLREEILNMRKRIDQVNVDRIKDHKNICDLEHSISLLNMRVEGEKKNKEAISGDMARNNEIIAKVIHHNKKIKNRKKLS
jgi:hypothetical protein